MLARGQKKTLVNFNLIEVDIEKNKFNKKNKVRVGLEFSNRKKYTYTYDKSFKDKYIIGHVPEGYYVVTSMETNRDFDRYSSRKVQCYNNKAPVYHLKSNKNYFLQNINTAPLKSQKAAIGDITSFIYGLLNINITFEPAMPIGYISFEGSDKNMIGNKIKCPKGKKFSFESKNPDTK